MIPALTSDNELSTLSIFIYRSPLIYRGIVLCIMMTPRYLTNVLSPWDIFTSEHEMSCWVVASISYGPTLGRGNLRPNCVDLFLILFNPIVILMYNMASPTGPPSMTKANMVLSYTYIQNNRQQIIVFYTL